MDLSLRKFTDRVAELGFSAQIPVDWIAHELPPEEPDFSNPTSFFPLALVTAPHAAIVFAFAARPAYDDGTLHDWAWYNLNNNQLTARAIGPARIAGVTAMMGEATQPSELGTMVVRFAFLEDGGRLINLTLTAPELLADAVREAWFAMIGSFALETPKGSRFTEETATPAPPPAVDPDIEAHKFASEAPEPPEPVAEKDPTFADFAFAGTAASLDPEAKVNANLRDKGIGLVPKVIATDDATKVATLAGGAILAHFNVPYGWYVIDDGKRTLVLDPKDEVQISLNTMATEGRDYDELLNELEAQVRKDYPEPECMRFAYGKIEALGVRNIAVGGQAIEQYHMLFPHRTDEMVLRARVTTSPERRTAACNLAELILNSCSFEPERREAPASVPAPKDLPAWWNKAVALEQQDRLEEAEQVIRDGVPHLAFAHATADMYRLRMLRLKSAGDAPGALAAFKKSSHFIFFYASMATSGGEGTALSEERDEFREQLVSDYGSDPGA
ncbi:MAG: hypothetical protein ABI599_11385 [Flavobacteriales bacterium]